MAQIINLIEETEVPDAQAVGPQPAPLTSQRSISDGDIRSAFAGVNVRLQATEQTIQGLPKVAGVFRALAAALGARVVMFFALLGALGLAVPAALYPDPWRIGIFAAFSILVYLPLAVISYLRGN